jgi:hypothetical protein
MTRGTIADVGSIERSRRPLTAATSEPEASGGLPRAPSGRAPTPCCGVPPPSQPEVLVGTGLPGAPACHVPHPDAVRRR